MSEEEDLERLLHLLNTIEAADMPSGESYTMDETSSIYQEIVSLADGLLITAKGHCNWSNHQILQTAGFRVFPGEKDSFGWLTGGIRVPGIGNIWYG